MNKINKAILNKLINNLPLNDRQKEVVMLICDTAYYMGQKVGIEETTEIWRKHRSNLTTDSKDATMGTNESD